MTTSCVVLYINQKDFLKNEKHFEKYFDGKIVKLDYKRSSGRTYVYFKNVEDAQHNLAKKTIEISKSNGKGMCTLRLKPFKSYSPTINEQIPSEPMKYVDFVKDSNVRQVIVYIKTKHFNPTEEYLKNLFSNKELTGGGEICRLSYINGLKKCYIYFREREVASQLAAKQKITVQQDDKTYTFVCKLYKTSNTAMKKLNISQKINQIDLQIKTKREFDQIYFKHFLLMENRQTRLFWIKEYSNFKDHFCFEITKRQKSNANQPILKESTNKILKKIYFLLNECEHENIIKLENVLEKRNSYVFIIENCNASLNF